MTVFRTATLRTFSLAIFAGAKELNDEKYIKNKAFSCMLDENRKDELKT